MQPTVGSADAENLLFVAHGADCIGEPEDINEAERVDYAKDYGLVWCRPDGKPLTLRMDDDGWTVPSSRSTA
jgi:hypothetical protein